MSYRNNHSGQRNRHHTDPSSSRQNTKYNQRNGQRNYRPEPSRRLIGSDDVDSLMSSLDNHLTTNVQDSSANGRGGRYPANRRPTRSTPQMRVAQSNQTGWWRITVPDAGNIGKDRVMFALRAHCPRQFQAYHYAIDVKNKAGVFFVNSQQDADMLKRANNKVDVQGLDIIRVQVSRVPAPAPAIDEDARPHFKDFLLNRRFDQQMLKLDLSHLADDEELSSLGIYPQFNKHAFVRDVVNIVNAHIPTTRQLDLGSNNIVNLYEFRNLHLENLMLLSLASNQLKNVDDFDHLKQLPHLAHVYINNNPLVSTNSKRNTSLDDVISCITHQASIIGSICSHSSTIRQKLPQLKRIDNVDLPPTIRFATDIETTALPASQPHCVPHDMQGFLKNFIDEYFRLFDTRGRSELHACYHDTCMLSLCIAAADSYIVPTRQFKFGALIYESRNLQKIADDNKRMMLLRHGKTAVIDFLRIKFPLTKHDDTSFHVDVISTANNRAIFSVNGLFKEVEQTTNCPIRSFQRTFTCAQTATGVLIIADHILITNATDAQISKMNRSTPAPAPVPTLQPANGNNDVENQMVLKFSQQSGMNIAYSKLCLQENNWNYDKAAEVFLAAHEKKLIPSEAFSQS